MRLVLQNPWVAAGAMTAQTAAGGETARRAAQQGSPGGTYSGGTPSASAHEDKLRSLRRHILTARAPESASINQAVVDELTAEFVKPLYDKNASAAEPNPVLHTATKPELIAAYGAALEKHRGGYGSPRNFRELLARIEMEFLDLSDEGIVALLTMMLRHFAYPVNDDDGVRRDYFRRLEIGLAYVHGAQGVPQQAREAMMEAWSAQMSHRLAHGQISHALELVRLFGTHLSLLNPAMALYLAMEAALACSSRLPENERGELLEAANRLLALCADYSEMVSYDTLSCYAERLEQTSDAVAYVTGLSLLEVLWAAAPADARGAFAAEAILMRPHGAEAQAVAALEKARARWLEEIRPADLARGLMRSAPPVSNPWRLGEILRLHAKSLPDIDDGLVPEVLAYWMNPEMSGVFFEEERTAAYAGLLEGCLSRMGEEAKAALGPQWEALLRPMRTSFEGKRAALVKRFIAVIPENSRCVLAREAIAVLGYLSGEAKTAWEETLTELTRSLSEAAFRQLDESVLQAIGMSGDAAGMMSLVARLRHETSPERRAMLYLAGWENLTRRRNRHDPEVKVSTFEKFLEEIWARPETAQAFLVHLLGNTTDANRAFVIETLKTGLGKLPAEARQGVYEAGLQRLAKPADGQVQEPKSYLGFVGVMDGLPGTEEMAVTFDRAGISEALRLEIVKAGLTALSLMSGEPAAAWEKALAALSRSLSDASARGIDAAFIEQVGRMDDVAGWMQRAVHIRPGMPADGFGELYLAGWDRLNRRRNSYSPQITPSTFAAFLDERWARPETAQAFLVHLLGKTTDANRAFVLDTVKTGLPKLAEDARKRVYAEFLKSMASLPAKQPQDMQAIVSLACAMNAAPGAEEVGVTFNRLAEVGLPYHAPDKVKEFAYAYLDKVFSTAGAPEDVLAYLVSHTSESNRAFIFQTLKDHLHWVVDEEKRLKLIAEMARVYGITGLDGEASVQDQIWYVDHTLALQSLIAVAQSQFAPFLTAGLKAPDVYLTKTLETAVAAFRAVPRSVHETYFRDRRAELEAEGNAAGRLYLYLLFGGPAEFPEILSRFISEKRIDGFLEQKLKMRAPYAAGAEIAPFNWYRFALAEVYDAGVLRETTAFDGNQAKSHGLLTQAQRQRERIAKLCEKILAIDPSYQPALRAQAYVLFFGYGMQRDSHRAAENLFKARMALTREDAPLVAQTAVQIWSGLRDGYDRPRYNDDKMRELEPRPFQLWRLASRLDPGDAISWSKLGVCYLQGRGTEKDLERAAEAHFNAVLADPTLEIVGNYPLNNLNQLGKEDPKARELAEKAEAVVATLREKRK